MEGYGMTGSGKYYADSPAMTIAQPCKPNYEQALESVSQRLKRQAEFGDMLEGMMLAHELPRSEGMDALLGNVRMSIASLKRDQQNIMDAMERDS